MKKLVKAFIAIDINDKLQTSLVRWQSSLMRELGPHSITSIVSKEDFHLTLRYLGETADIPTIIECLEQIKFEPFELYIDSVGSFSGESSDTIVWAGVSGNTYALQALKENIDAILQPFSYTEEEHDFVPHITLLYSEGIEDDNIQRIKLDPEKILINEIKLYRILPNSSANKFQVLRDFKMNSG